MVTSNIDEKQLTVVKTDYYLWILVKNNFKNSFVF